MDYIIELLPTFIFGGVLGGFFVYMFRDKTKKED